MEITRKLSRKMTVFLFIFLGFMLTSTNVSAIGLKLSNDTEYMIRARAHDRGKWRPWVTFLPGEWGYFAKMIMRTTHDIEIQIYVDGDWEFFYTGNHGTKIFTRIIQVVEEDKKDYFRLIWWDEPPGCRDRPPLPSQAVRTCLKGSRQRGSLFWYRYDKRYQRLRIKTGKYLVSDI